MKLKKKLGGLTLVELTISIVIISIAFLTIINLISMVSAKSVNSRHITAANYLLLGKMEEWKAKGYINIGTPAGPSVWKSFDSTVSGNPLDYPGKFGEYFYQTEVQYISLNTDPVAVDSSGSAPRSPKRLTVRLEKRTGAQVDFRVFVSTLLVGSY